MILICIDMLATDTHRQPEHAGKMTSPRGPRDHGSRETGVAVSGPGATEILNTRPVAELKTLFDRP
jgi:hypothetical protein